MSGGLLDGVLGALLTQDSPVDIGGEFLASHDLDAGLACSERSGRSLDRGAMLGRDRLASIDPVPDVLLLDTNGGGEAGLPAKQVDRALESFHMAKRYNSCGLRSNSCGLRLTTAVVRLPRMAMGKRIEEALDGRQQKLLYGSIEGLTQQNLSLMISRDSTTSEFAIRIADKLGVSIRWLLDGVGDKHSTDWPFPSIPRARFDALTRDQRSKLEGMLDLRIEQLQAETPAAKRKRA